MYNRILALDQSSRISGYAVFNGTNQLEKNGKFTFDNQDIGIRLHQIRTQVRELIDTYKPELVIFEDIQQQNNVANNVQTFKILAEVLGIIQELCIELSIPYQIVSATSWKSVLGIKGKTRPEQKRNAQEYVINKYNIKPTQDECDAICIGEYYYQYSVNDWS